MTKRTRRAAATGLALLAVLGLGYLLGKSDAVPTKASAAPPVEPRLAIGYHFFNDFDTEPEVRRRVRKTYDGPLALATDYMVFNVTKDDIKVRMSAIDEEIWPSPPLKAKIAPDTGGAIAFSKFTISGALGLPEVVGPIYDEVSEIYGTDYEPLFKE